MTQAGLGTGHYASRVSSREAYVFADPRRPAQTRPHGQRPCVNEALRLG